jgi:hypothetical protein
MQTYLTVGILLWSIHFFVRSNAYKDKSFSLILLDMAIGILFYPIIIGTLIYVVVKEIVKQRST